MNIGYNSTSYQIIERRTLWKGSYLTNVAYCTHADHNSVLLKEAEVRSFKNHSGIKNPHQAINWQ